MNSKLENKSLKVILTGGGTGGHVYPSLAIYNILKKNFTISAAYYIGCKGKAEEKIVPKSGLPIKFISSSPISGVSKNKIPLAFFRIFKGFLSSLFFLLKFKPDIVLASGGYVSAPVILAAFFLKPILKCKIILDEQNVFPGLLNRFGSLFADLVFLSFRESVKFIWNNRCVHSGYPVRDEFLKDYNLSEVRRKLGLPMDKFILLISGGSMGARNINRVIAKTVSELKKFDNLLIIHSCGLSKYPYNGFEDVKGILKDEGIPFEIEEDGEIKRGVVKKDGVDFYIFTNFIFQMSDYMKSADLVISRAGAGSITEICALGKPSILIPKRDLPGFHQELNGISLSEKGGCRVLFEKKNREGHTFVDEGEFLSLFSKLFESRDILREMGKVSRGVFNGNFEKIIRDNVLHLLNGDEINFINPLTVSKGISFEGEIEKIISFLKKQKKDSMYVKFFNTKVDEYLESDSWVIFNKGVKLAGALRRSDKLEILSGKFQTSNGFVRRNILSALMGMDIKLNVDIKNVLDVALKDSYYEVRREGIKLLRKFQNEVEDREKYRDLLLSLLNRYFQHFEVKCEVIKTLPYFVYEKVYYEIVAKYIKKENVSYREAVLDGILNGFADGIFKDRRSVYNLALKMLITTSYFEPRYGIREKYRRLYNFLEKMG